MTQKLDNLQAALQEALGERIASLVRDRGEITITVPAARYLETARLLLLSRSSRFPRGLGNDSGLVGRNLVFSNQTKGEAG